MGRIIRVVVVGGRGVGKTAILERAVFGTLLIDKPYVPTVEDIYAGFVETEKGSKEKMRFYDTAGLDVRNRIIPPHYHAVADAYLLVYSITDKISFQLLTDIKRDIDRNREKRDAPVIVLGNKIDLIKEKAVDNHQVENWLYNEKVKHWETSVQDRNSLIDPLMHLSSKFSVQPNKSTFAQLSMTRKYKD